MIRTAIKHSSLLWLIGILLPVVAQAAQPQAADPLPNELRVNGVDFILVPEGEFWYSVLNGGRFNSLPRGVPEYRTHRVWIDGFYIAKYEAIAKDLARFLNSGDVDAALEAHFLEQWHKGTEAEILSGDGCTLAQDSDGIFVAKDTQADYPATYLSWTMAYAFARWMGFELPTEAQWQKAARGTDQRIWPWGDTFPDDTYALFGRGRDCHPAPVDSYPKGRSSFGLHHMSGNVSEYVADWMNDHFDAAITDGIRNPKLATEAFPIRRGKPSKMIKGNSWSREVVGLAIARRNAGGQMTASNRTGVRFALSLSEARRLIQQDQQGAAPAQD